MKLGAVTLALASCASPEGQGTAQAAGVQTAGREAAFAANARLQHSVNFGNMLEAPTEGAWGLKMQERFFDLAKAAGFKAIRLPIRWNAHAAEQAPYTVDSTFYARVDWAVAQARKRGLGIILDFHHYEELMTDPAGHRARFLGIWKGVAEHYRKQGPDVLFEVLNEPNGKLSAEWNDLQTAALAVIRRSNPARVVIVGPGGWNSAEQLVNLRLPADPHLIVTFHTYSPIEFTHQGTDFTGTPKPSGITWPAGGLRPANGWASWSWDVALAGTASGIQVTPKKAWGALYVHRDVPLMNVNEISFVADRPVQLGVVCLETNDGKTPARSANVLAQAGVATRIKVADCGGSGTVRDLWLMLQGNETQPSVTFSRLELLTAAGPQPVLGSPQDEAVLPIRTAAAWGKANNRPVFMGEFGAYRAGPNADRVRWAGFLRAEAERLGVSWAWWELASGFGVYDPVKNVWDAGVLKSLLPGTKVVK